MLALTAAISSFAKSQENMSEVVATVLFVSAFDKGLKGLIAAGIPGWLATREDGGVRPAMDAPHLAHQSLACCSQVEACCQSRPLQGFISPFDV